MALAISRAETDSYSAGTGYRMKESALLEYAAMGPIQECARAAIAALDRHRGECVPVDKLRAKIKDMQDETFPAGGRLAALNHFQFWLSHRGWLSDETPPVIQTEKRKP